jgi:predicted nucleic acid-binding protein
VRFLDTNTFLRYLVAPQSSTDQQKYRACAALFQRVKAGTEQVTTCEAVFTEVLYNLCSSRQYNLSHQDAAARFRPLILLSGLTLPQKRIYVRALDLFASSSSLDIEDCLIVAHMERQGIKELLSYDTDFDQVSTITRQEPLP